MCEKLEHNVITTSKGIGVENHPFNNPDDLAGARYLIVGSFPPYRFSIKHKQLNKNDVDWFYGSKDNDFWGKGGVDGLLQCALGCQGKVLATKEERKIFCENRGIAFLDLFQTIKRYDNLSSDSNIFPIEIVDLTYYLDRYDDITTIFFTSSWVEQIAKKEYLRINRDNLPLNRKGEKPTSVEGGVFYRFKEGKKSVKIRKLTSPSPMNSGNFQSKLEKWRNAIKNTGLDKMVF
ncbi:hypothetical protein [Helicobacter brantae]|uniref:Uncharacterized protein n=1 Tax=Helicobacter brantae TaxID=375927 RepID=A0A3D8IZC7_9HELI|nr:hypothetical protein [Helicobacter brantae]RDU70300.1 hypothetical protein CQA58_06135 [Helicobacter brantae]